MPFILYFYYFSFIQLKIFSFNILLMFSITFLNMPFKRSNLSFKACCLQPLKIKALKQAIHDMKIIAVKNNG